MYRSISTNRVSEDGYYNQSPTSRGVSPALRALALEANELPHYEPSPSEPSKKEKIRARLSDKAVHLIPIVLLLCALLLWLFSNPDIETPLKDDLIMSNIKGITLEGEIDTDSTSQRDNSQGVDISDLGLPKHEDDHKLASTLGN